MEKNELQKKNQIIDELAQRLILVDGEITDLLTRETMQNLNESSQNATGAIAISSALVGQIGNAALASFTASDEGIEVSDFAIEITDHNNAKYYFTGCFPVVIFQKGDRVKVIAEPLSGQKKYMDAVAVIDLQKKYMWTGQEVVKGRFRYRIFGMKLGGGVAIFCLIVAIVFFLFLENGYLILLSPLVSGTFFFCILLFIYGGWHIGGSFEEQSIKLEAILKKLGFHKPSRMDLQDFALNDLSWKNKEDNKGYGHERWKDYTYRIDLAKKADEEKYEKKEYKKRQNHS